MTRALLILLALLHPVTYALAATPSEEPAAEQRLVTLLNQERALHHLPPLKFNPRLLQSARLHCERMVAEKQLSHQFPGEPAVAARISAEGIRWNTVAENVGYASDIDGLHQGWVLSPPHHHNMLDPRFTDVGIAVLHSGDLYYADQNFARVTTESAPDVAEHRFAAALDAERKRLNLSPLTVTSNLKLREAACAMADHDQLSAQSLTQLGLGTHFFAFAVSEPEMLTPAMQQVAADRSVTSLQAGACYKVTPTYPGGVYWFGASY